MPLVLVIMKCIRVITFLASKPLITDTTRTFSGLNQHNSIYSSGAFEGIRQTKTKGSLPVFLI